MEGQERAEDWQEVFSSSSILFSHILSRVSVVFSVLTCSPTYCRSRREHSVHVFHPHTVIKCVSVVFSVPILFLPSCHTRKHSIQGVSSCSPTYSSAATRERE